MWARCLPQTLDATVSEPGLQGTLGFRAISSWIPLEIVNTKFEVERNIAGIFFLLAFRSAGLIPSCRATNRVFSCHEHFVFKVMFSLTASASVSMTVTHPPHRWKQKVSPLSSFCRL